MNLFDNVTRFRRSLVAFTRNASSRRPLSPGSADYLVPALTAALLLTSVEVGRAAPQAPCETSQVSLNTGYDHENGGGVLTIDAVDPRWIVVSDPFSTTQEPRPATVITPSTAWKPAQPQSMWISGYPDSAQNQNGTYIFETVFCLKTGIDFNDPNARLDIAMRADDACTAYLNGGLTPFHVGQVFNSATVTTSSYPLGAIGAVVGQNTLSIRVANINSVAMGLNLVATLFAEPNNTAETPACCSAYAALQGYKFDDLNGNGVQDTGEPLLSGWQINLSSSNGVNLTTTTDSAGYYSFVYLPPAVYTLTETLQSGWIQTYPASGSHVVTTTGIQGVNGLAFGNRFVGPCATDQVTLNTGYDRVNSALLATGTIDPSWLIVADPIGGTTEPRPASVIASHVGWQPAIAQTQWISGYPTTSQPVNGAYIFETYFCLGAGFDNINNLAQLSIGMRADDACRAFLNGNTVPFHTGQAFGAGVVTVTSYVLANIGGVLGTNTLRIQVDNISGVAMGLDVVSMVTAPSFTALKPDCCSNAGALQGIKFHDLNSNGVRDIGEPTLTGWPILLSGSNGLLVPTVTDSQGFYSFVGLDPATYTLTETMQSGWTQTAPLSGSHVVALSGIQGVNNLDFGNVFSGPPPPAVYCTAGTTTNGCNASISGTGVASATAGSGFTINVANVEGGQNGILFYGLASASSSWGSGSSSFLCVKSPLERMGVQSTSGTHGACDGSMSIDWNTYYAVNPLAIGHPYAPGLTIYAQAWFRDPPAPKTTSLSNGLSFNVNP